MKLRHAMVSGDALSGRVESSPAAARVRAGLARGLWVASLMLVMLGVGLRALHLVTSHAAHVSPSGMAVATVFLAVQLALATLGTLIVSRREGNAVGWIFCLAGFVLALATFTESYTVYASTASGPAPGADVAAWLTNLVQGPSLLGFFIFLLLFFPNGRLASPAWRPVAWIASGVVAAATLLESLAPGPLGSFQSVDNPFGVDVLQGIITTARTVVFLLLMLSLLASAGALFLRFRGSEGVERQQLKWVMTSGALVAAVVLMGPIIWSIPALAGTFWSVLFALAFASIPLSAAVAVLRYRLYDLDLIINRTLVYGALTMIVAAVYVLVVGGLGTLLQARGNVFISLLGAALVALIFAPLRQRLQAAVNRMMYGHRDEPELALSHLGRRLEAAVSPDAILPTIVHTVKDALRLPYAAIELREDASPDMERVVSAGSPPPNPVRLSLVYQGEWIGNLVVAPRVGEDGFTPADRHLLDDLVRQAGVAVHAVRLTTDLQRSRERLVTAREEERRRLRHDLHDGLGPALASMSLQVAAVRSLVADEPEASAMLTSLKTQMQEAVADVRRLVYALRPPTLDEFGLVQALREYAARYRVLEGGSSVHGEGLRVIIEAPGSLPAMSAAVETAVYRIALEAITNAARHSCAQCCTVHLSVVGTELQVEIADDGVGIPVEYRAGTGMISMRERARELGGSFDVRRADDGGTRVCARLPIGDSYE